MSVCQRNAIIQEYVPLLIKQLTGFKDDDVNMQKCEQSAWNIIKNHRHVCTNSHEVRRHIKGLQERLCIENLGEYAEYLGLLCDQIITHPLCLNHYEIDIHWSLLDFLFAIAYNPTGTLKHNPNKVKIKSLSVNDINKKDEEDETYWANILKKDFIDVKSYVDDNSELSDWSDDDKSTKIQDTGKDESSNIENNTIKFSDPLFENITPPQKCSPFIQFNYDCNAEKLLEDQIQHSWWLIDRRKQSEAIVESSLMEANFAILYNRFISETWKLIPRPTLFTVSELNLMREVLWMFHVPHECTMFRVSENFHIKKRHNYTIPSVTEQGLTEYLNEQFLPFINMMYTLRSFQKTIYNNTERLPPRTIECYAANLKLHVEPIWEELVAYEHRLVVQKDFDINTLINMRRTLNDAFNRLQCLYDIHEKVYIDHLEYPAHICSAFLLASLGHCFHNTSEPTKANLTMSLLLTAIKVFCDIIDTWWSEGHLDDWQEEYVVKRISDLDQAVCARDYGVNKGKSFFVFAKVSETIMKDRLFKLMLEYSLEVGRTLNLLYEINRIGDLRNNCLMFEDKLYNTFIRDFLSQVKIFQNSIISNGDKADEKEEKVKDENANEQENQKHFTADAATNIPDENEINLQSILNNLTTKDELLLSVFALNTSSTNIKDELQRNINAAPNALNIYQQLQESLSSAECILPLEEILLQTLSQILDKRITFANSFVISLYHDEFMILKHLRNIRFVLLLEGSDIMHQFYTKLFKEIECGDNWANASILTMQLEGVICTKYPEMSSLFHVDINSVYRRNTNKAYEVVDDLVITYNSERELSFIISSDDIEAYNKIFRFLLKIKWGLTTLEELSFSRKRRRPFDDLRMIDLIMRRLEQLRFWMIFALQSVHFHLMAHVLQSLGKQLEIKINKCKDLKEMDMVHKSYLSIACEHCLLVDNLSAIKIGIEQLLGLTYIVRLEWLACLKYMEYSNNPLAVELSDSSSSDCVNSNYVADSKIDAIELTYIRCHQYIANQLNNEVYLKNKHFLSGLSAAFNKSTPY